MSKKTEYDLRCSFCNKHQNDCYRLVASSPTTCICDQCVEHSCKALSQHCDVPSGLLIVTQNPSLQCSFCHKPVVEELRMISVSENNICEECVFAIRDLLQEEEKKLGKS